MSDPLLPVSPPPLAADGAECLVELSPSHHVCGVWHADAREWTCRSPGGGLTWLGLGRARRWWLLDPLLRQEVPRG